MGSKWTKVLAAAVVLAIALAPAGDAVAKKKKKKKIKPPAPIVRVDTFDYTGPAGVRAQGNSGNACVEGNACATFTPQEGELFVTVEVTDTSGTPAPIFVDIAGAGGEFCGTTGEPIALNGATEVDVWVEGAIPGTCQAVGTQGTITATFTNVEAPAS